MDSRRLLISLTLEYPVTDAQKFDDIVRKNDWNLIKGNHENQRVIDLTISSIAKTAARSRAIEVVESVLRGHVSAFIVEAARIDVPFQPGHGYVLDWNKPNRCPNWLWSTLTGVGLFSTGHSITVPPAAYPESHARALLTRSSVAHRAGWSGSHQQLRPLLVPKVLDVMTAGTRPHSGRLAEASWRLFGFLLAIGSGALLASHVTSLWWALVLVFPALVSAGFFSSLTDNASGVNWRRGS